ncbi:MAG: substrate-binding domain-containing protein [Ruminococcus sp.]
MKKITSIVLSVSMAAGALGMNTAVVHAEESAKKVAYISAANQFDFFVYIGAEIKKVGEENGVQVDMFDAALDVSKEADLMSQAILQKYDAIIVGPVDTQALIPSIKEANEAGIPVINYTLSLKVQKFMPALEVEIKIWVKLPANMLLIC